MTGWGHGDLMRESEGHGRIAQNGVPSAVVKCTKVVYKLDGRYLTRWLDWTRGYTNEERGERGEREENKEGQKQASKQEQESRLTSYLGGMEFVDQVPTVTTLRSSRHFKKD